MVKYWKKVLGESKTGDANPTGYGAYETLLETSLTLKICTLGVGLRTNILTESESHVF